MKNLKGHFEATCYQQMYSRASGANHPVGLIALDVYGFISQIGETHRLRVISIVIDWDEMLFLIGFPPKILWLTSTPTSQYTNFIYSAR